MDCPWSLGAWGGVAGTNWPSRCGSRDQMAAGGDFAARRGQANDGGKSFLRTPVRRAINTVAVRRPRLTVQTNAFY